MIERRILLSGGIGSGKSAAARILRQRGFDVIDADYVGHQVLEPTGEAFAEVVREWPVVLIGGRIDRALLAKIVFEDGLALRRLEAISHPAIRERIMRLVAELDAAVVFVEVPLLSDFFPRSWMRVVVDAADEIRFRRLLDRGMKKRDIRFRMHAQPSRAEWLEAADWVITNDGDLESLAVGVEEFLAAIGN